MLDRVLELYAARGIEELGVGALRSNASADLGTIVELTRWFGGTERLYGAMERLNTLIYEASRSSNSSLVLRLWSTRN